MHFQVLYGKNVITFAVKKGETFIFKIRSPKNRFLGVCERWESTVVVSEDGRKLCFFEKKIRLWVFLNLEIKKIQKLYWSLLLLRRVGRGVCLEGLLEHCSLVDVFWRTPLLVSNWSCLGGGFDIHRSLRKPSQNPHTPKMKNILVWCSLTPRNTTETPAFFE
jgi:hypothetical protein